MAVDAGRPPGLAFPAASPMSPSPLAQDTRSSASRRSSRSRRSAIVVLVHTIDVDRYAQLAIAEVKDADRPRARDPRQARHQPLPAARRAGRGRLVRERRGRLAAGDDQGEAGRRRGRAAAAAPPEGGDHPARGDRSRRAAREGREGRRQLGAQAARGGCRAAAGRRRARLRVRRRRARRRSREPHLAERRVPRRRCGSRSGSCGSRSAHWRATATWSSTPRSAISRSR